MPGGGGVKGGGTATGKPDPKCVELDEKNKAERKKFIEKTRRKKELTKQEETALAKARRGGMTFSSAESSIGGTTSSMTQSSSGLVNDQITKDLSGGTSEQKMGLNQKTRNSTAKKHDAKKKKAGVLCDGSHVHPGGGKGAHGECKIFNNLTNEVGAASMRGGSVLLNIDWRRNTPNGGVQNSGMPCEDCYAMLCHAVCECEIEIMICDKNNKPTPLTEENCQDEYDGYSDLCTRVDGGPKPGR